MEAEELTNDENRKKAKRLKQLKRTFNADDADFIENNRVVCNIFLTDLACPLPPNA